MFKIKMFSTATTLQTRQKGPRSTTKGRRGKAGLIAFSWGRAATMLRTSCEHAATVCPQKNEVPVTVQPHALRVSSLASRPQSASREGGGVGRGRRGDPLLPFPPHFFLPFPGLDARQAKVQPRFGRS